MEGWGELRWSVRMSGGFAWKVFSTAAGPRKSPVKVSLRKELYAVRGQRKTEKHEFPVENPTWSQGYFNRVNE